MLKPRQSTTIRLARVASLLTYRWRARLCHASRSISPGARLGLNEHTGTPGVVWRGQKRRAAWGMTISRASAPGVQVVTVMIRAEGGAALAAIVDGPVEVALFFKKTCC